MAKIAIANFNVGPLESKKALRVYAIAIECLKVNFSDYSFVNLLSKKPKMREKVLGPLIFQIPNDLRDHLNSGVFEAPDHQRVKDAISYLEHAQSAFTSYDNFWSYASNIKNAQSPLAAESISKANDQIPRITRNLTEAFERLKKFKS